LSRKSQTQRPGLTHVPSRHCEGESQSSYVPTVDEYTAAAKARLFKLYPANLTEDLADLVQQASQPPATPSHPNLPPPSDAPFLRAPARGLGIRAAVEKGMAEGRGVDIAAGTHSWDDDVLAVWPGAHLRVVAQERQVRLVGRWEMAEASSGSIARANLTYRGAEPGDQTVWIRGAGAWSFTDCDLRCLKGVTVRVTNGWREIAAPQPLAPFQLFRAVADPEARVLPASASFARCGLGGVDPDRALRPGHLDPEERQVTSKATILRDTSCARRHPELVRDCAGAVRARRVRREPGELGAVLRA
jgi:hypothetical protein